MGGNVGVSLVLPGVIDTPMAEAAALDPRPKGSGRKP